MANSGYNIWTDYLELNKVVQDMIEARHKPRYSGTETMRLKLSTGLHDTQSWRVLSEFRQREQSIPENSVTKEQHEAEALTMEPGTGLWLTDNALEKMHRKEHMKEHHLCDGSTELQHFPWIHYPIACDCSAERQAGFFGCEFNRMNNLAPKQKGAIKRNNLLKDHFFQSCLLMETEEPCEFSVVHSGGNALLLRGKTSNGDFTNTPSTSKVGQDPNKCMFCKRNGESKNTYTSHALKDVNGKIVCPILRQYICPLCHATGDKAHTKRFCHLQGNYRSMYKKAARD
ncbi:uncharacterized protein [Narcine bancroftii]|uniref:uncharacterized protein n=1 Tax=Narcine bancroftii TaxID=1343680 RepID=UPI003831CBBA